MSQTLTSSMVARIVIVTLALVAPAVAQEFEFEGLHVDTCSCAPPCACEMIGLEHGCQGVAVDAITSGSFDGQDLSGVRIASAVIPAGEKIRFYIDADSAEKRKAAEAFARAAYKPFGKVDAVKDAKVDIQGEDGNYTVKVDDGEVMTFETEPVLGGDNKTPIVHSNVKNPIASTTYQGKNVSAEYHDGDESFSLKGGSNAYFNDRIKSNGTLGEEAK